MDIKILIWPFLLTVYFLVLSFNLTGLPLYLDEGLYIFWAYLFSTDTSYAYISMQDGKTPLFIWALTSLNNFVDYFLLSGRLISVFASTLSLICWLIIGAKMFGSKILKWIFILFLVTPFNVLISRLAFVDSLLIAFFSLSILGLFFAREFALKRQLLKTLLFAFLCGISLGLAFLTKSTARIFLIAEGLILVFWALQSLKDKNFKAAGLLTISAFIITGLYFEITGYLKFASLKHWEMISIKESVLVFSLSELYRKFIVEQNFSVHIKNIQVTIGYILVYFGTVLVFFISGITWMFKEKKHLWALLLVLILSAGVFLSAKVPASRYLAIIIPAVLVISSFGAFRFWEKGPIALRVFSIFLLSISAFFSFKLIFMPMDAYYASDDRANFIDYNLNALGLEESIGYLEPKKGFAAVAVTGIWGVAEGSLVGFKEREIEVYPTTKVVNGLLKEDKPCEKDFKEVEGKCWKINFGEVMQSPKEKYVYFISEHIDIATLKKLIDFEIVKDFQRRRTNLHVYLIKINGPSFPDN